MVVGARQWDIPDGVALYEAGWSVVEVAAEVGVAPTTVYAQLKRAGVTFRTFRRGDVATADIVRMRDQERLSWRQIEARTGMAHGAIRYRYAQATARSSS